MPDWNPAEIIDANQNLYHSLYIENSSQIQSGLTKENNYGYKI